MQQVPQLSGGRALEELLACHRDELRRSGLSDASVDVSGFYSADADKAAGFLGFNPRSGGWVVPYPGTEDEQGAPFRRFKPDVPFLGRNQKPAKYLSPRKKQYPAGNRLFIPAMLNPAILSDPSTTLLLTEGEKKAIKACQEGFPTVGLSGVTCWVSKGGNGESFPIRDLDLIEWSGRRVVILFDSDAAKKTAVRDEEHKLSRELSSRGANCLVGRLPKPTAVEDQENGLKGKFGLDDLLAIRGSAALDTVVQEARAPRKPQSKRGGRKRKPPFHETAREYLAARGLAKGSVIHLRWWRGSFWRWDGRAYREWANEDVRADVMRYVQGCDDLQDYCTDHFVRNVLANLHGVCGTSRDVSPPDWLSKSQTNPSRCIVVENGILDVEALLNGADEVVFPHTPDLFALNALPFAFDSDAECPTWDRVLERILPDEDSRQFLREWFGYCLTPETWLQKFVVMVGDGANGKSVVCSTLGKLLGEENVSAVPIERFRDTHNLVGTLGKLANVVAEFEEIDRATEGSLKSFVSADPMEFNPKYKPTFTARPTARLVAATNNLPVMRDKSWGPYRRMILLNFGVRIPESEQDPHLVEKLKAELSGILNWGLVGLFQLLNRGAILEPSSSVALREEYRRACNPARVFLDERLHCVPTGSVSKREVYQEYRSFCLGGGYKPLNEAHFAREVYRLFRDRVTSTRKRSPGRREAVFSGLGWREPAHESEAHESHGSSFPDAVAPGGQGGQGGQRKSLCIPSGAP